MPIRVVLVGLGPIGAAVAGQLERRRKAFQIVGAVDIDPSKMGRDAGEVLESVYNLGSGDGVSVGEIMRAVAAVTGIEFEPEIGPRRPGDPARIVASGELAARDLDWRMRHSLAQMVESAWEARRAAPDA